MNAASMVAARDGTRLHVQGWGMGRPILFVAAWALDSGSWGSAMVAWAPRWGGTGGHEFPLPRRDFYRGDGISLGYVDPEDDENV